MRIFEVLNEDYNQSLEADLNNLLVSASAVGAQEVKTGDLVRQLQASGYSVDINSLLTLLTDNPMVLNATPDLVRFSEPAPDTEQGVDSAEKVKSMAAKATKIG